MVALNMSMFNSLSIVLGSAQYPNGSLQLQQESKMSGSGDSYGNSPCCPHSHGCCGCHDPCSLDPPDVCVDPLKGIPTDDMGLMTLVGLKWPRRDLHWFLDGFKILVLTGRFRGKRDIGQIESQPFNHGSRVRRLDNRNQSGQATESEIRTTIGGSTTPNPTTTVPTTAESTTTQPTTTPPTTTPPTTTPPATSSSGETTTSVPFTKEEEEDLEVFAEEKQLRRIVDLLDKDITEQKGVAVEAGENELLERDTLEEGLRGANLTFDNDTATLKHQTAFRRTDPISTNMARLAIIVGGATLSLKDQFQLPNVSLSGLCLLGPLSSDCLRKFLAFKRPTFEIHGPNNPHRSLHKRHTLETCDPNDPYRTLDGSCNNVDHFLWGAAFTPYRRELAAVYNDGESSFRRAVNGDKLPSARLISTTVNNVKNVESHSLSILHMTYGQFVDHDLVATPLSRTANGGYGGGPVKCCRIPSFFLRFFHPECAPIDIPSNDPFYRCYGQTCMEFVRSAPVAPDCFPGPRNQNNQQTAYLDGSVIYGVKPSETDQLRLGMNGLLKGQLSQDGRMLLPRETNLDDECNRPDKISQGEFCFRAGDGRVNEQILLTFFQTLWAREHNRVARILKECNEGWDDERLFQEARRIVGAQLQQVTYSEYLPTIISPVLMQSSGLFPLTGGEQTDDYNNKLRAGIANSFAAASYRFGHSLIADNLLYVTKQGKVSPRELSTLFFNPFELYRKNGVCDVARGGINLPGDKMDPLFTLEVAGKLFRGPKPFGLDLLALNIQRGRDHGLAPYNDWREFCGLRKANNFQDLLDEMSQERIDALRSVYTNVDDIDLYIGGVSEDPIPGAILGYTFTCLIHSQFFRMKYGDRYWFEYKNGPGNFTEAQMKQLHRVTLARIMCNNLPELDYIQRWPLKNPGPDNPKVCCKSIRQYNLNPWKPDFNDEDGDHEHDEHSDCSESSDHKDHHDCCSHEKDHNCCSHEKDHDCCSHEKDHD